MALPKNNKDAPYLTKGPTGSDELQVDTLPPSESPRDNQDTKVGRRPSRLRLFPTGLTRVLRSGSDAKRLQPVIHAETEITIEQSLNGRSIDSPSNDNSPENLKSMMEEAARWLPSPLGNHRAIENLQERVSSPIPTTVKAAIDMLPEVKLLQSDGDQDIWVSVEISGLLHHGQKLSDPRIDVVFIIDNGYYVSKDCLSHALQTATGALQQLDRGDRIALYTTHCTHGSVASTVPDRLLPLRYVSSETEDLFRNLTLDITKYGTQAWTPPRPTPAMADVILAIAKSLGKDSLEQGRCHMILLSPIFDALHIVSDTFPGLRIHQINPASLPYIPNEEHRQMVCTETCCKNVFVSNWTHYQSVPSCIKQIILQARSELPIGHITDVHVDLRPRSGCEVLEIQGSTTMSVLRPGQAFGFLVHIRVSPSKTEDLGPTSKDPLLDHSLDVTNLRHELRIAEKLGAKLTNVLSVQVFHKNSLNAAGTWCYTEAPLVVTKELGGLARPHDRTVDVYKRRVFHTLNNVNSSSAKKEVDKLALIAYGERENMQQVIQSMAKEVHWYHAVLEYETTSRQKLPLCTGFIDIASAENHEHIKAMLNAYKNDLQ